MKKVVVVLLLMLSIGVSGQKYPPVQPYNESGYKVSDLRRFLYENTSLSNSYQQEFLRVINKNLRSTGEYLNINEGQPLDESWIPWVLAKISIESKNLKGFMNSRNKNGQLDWYWDENSFYGPCFVFRFGNCSFIMAKTICMNLLDISADYVYSRKQPERQVVVEEQPVYLNRPVRDDWRPQEKPVVVVYTPEPEKKLIPEVKFKVGDVTIVVVGAAVLYALYKVVTNSEKRNTTIQVVIPTTIPTGNPGGTPTGETGGGPGGTPPSRK
jgi:hypothetical protein